MNKYLVTIEPDNVTKERWMIVIRLDGNLIKVPVRNLSYQDAVNMQHPIQYAFEGGVEQGFKITTKSQIFTCSSVFFNEDQAIINGKTLK